MSDSDTRTTVGVTRETRNALGMFKYQSDSETMDEALRTLLADAGVDVSQER